MLESAERFVNPSDIMAVENPGGLKVRRQPVRLEPDPRRVITRPFMPGAEEERLRRIVERVGAVSEERVGELLTEVERGFAGRHKNLRGVFAANFRLVSGLVDAAAISEARRLLIGAYLTCEYSLESVALFNPSMVPHPDQGGVPEGCCRFVMSLRACGEGHVSSIAFRTGVVDPSNGVTMDPLTRYAAAEHPVADRLYHKSRFFARLMDMGAYRPVVVSILDRLDERFPLEALRREVATERQSPGYARALDDTLDKIIWLAQSNYHLKFPEDSQLSERVIFPVSRTESRGIEDARFVRFVDDNGEVTYFGTYTAYDGFAALPQLIETRDFRYFKMSTLSGRCVQNKGMALFPRKIDGWYRIIGRFDGESIYYLTSDNIYFWNEAALIQGPAEPWEFVQIGNCGSPIETEAGWVLLTHGVGPMRRYCIGVVLLDLADPSRVIGRLKEPLIVPQESDRDGYVPNVVYSCGGMLHNGNLVIPYAWSDTATGVVTVALDELLRALKT